MIANDREKGDSVDKVHHSDDDQSTIITSELSLDSVFLIMEFLPLSDIHQMLLVCKSWNRLEKFEIFWKQILSHYLKSHERKYESLLKSSPSKHHTIVYNTLIGQLKKFYELHIIKERAVNREKFIQYMEQEEDSERSITFGARFKKLFISAILAHFNLKFSRTWNIISNQKFHYHLEKWLLSICNIGENSTYRSGTVCDLLFETLDHIIKKPKDGFLFQSFRTNQLIELTSFIFCELQKNSQQCKFDLKIFLEKFNPIITESHLLGYFTFMLSPNTQLYFTEYVKQPGNFIISNDHTITQELQIRSIFEKLVYHCFHNANLEPLRLAKTLFCELNKLKAWLNFITSFHSSQLIHCDILCSYQVYTTNYELYCCTVMEFLEIMEIEHLDVTQYQFCFLVSNLRFIDLCEDYFLPRHLLNSEDMKYLFHAHGQDKPHVAKYILKKFDVDIYGTSLFRNGSSGNMILNYFQFHYSISPSPSQSFGYLFTPEFGYETIDLNKLLQTSTMTMQDLKLTIRHTMLNLLSYEDIDESYELIFTRFKPLDLGAHFIVQLISTIRNTLDWTLIENGSQKAKAIQLAMDHIFVTTTITTTTTTNKEQKMSFSSYSQSIMQPSIVKEMIHDPSRFMNFDDTSEQYHVGLYLHALQCIKDLTEHAFKGQSSR
ncbi:hypothetical protein C9374_001862 [Naegleria lovaniensis]|uniref:F-box domain-containing protein n=1 Tax=Naegleria lovaniensis TaxID=51637 RepID=A0AA88GQ49_NAELO|nr:uncharacterized protein C9374_001862 [Naegleria lovaniensis]KAG2386827.1 hypothetical protein C9374_001862 [Naegleria lovaniensis]